VRKLNKARLRRLALKHSVYCRCPLGDPGCKCTNFKRAGLERLFSQLHNEMIKREKIAEDDEDGWEATAAADLVGFVSAAPAGKGAPLNAAPGPSINCNNSS
jgi:hypothetical protein